jgi:hypothetical protein
MIQTTSNRPRRRGRLFPEFTIPSEELARRKAERDQRCQRSQAIFDIICPKLMDEYYNWFMIIEPNSGDYFIDRDEEIAAQKAREKYPSGWLVTFRLNETGACGNI